MNTNINIETLRENYPNLYKTYCPTTKAFTFMTIENLSEEIASFLSEYDYELVYLLSADVIVLQPTSYEDNDGGILITSIDEALMEYGA